MDDEGIGGERGLHINNDDDNSLSLEREFCVLVFFGLTFMLVDGFWFFLGFDNRTW